MSLVDRILSTDRSVLFLRAEAVRIRRRSLSRSHSQFSICFVERNGAFDITARIQNANFTGAEARPGFRVVDCVLFLREDRLNAGSLETLPAQGCGLTSMIVI